MMDPQLIRVLETMLGNQVIMLSALAVLMKNNKEFSDCLARAARLTEAEIKFLEDNQQPQPWQA